MAGSSVHIWWPCYHEFGAEPELRAASVGARLAFHELLKLAARSASVGQVLVNGKVPSIEALAGIAAAPSTRDMDLWISELVDLGVLVRARNGRLDYLPMIRRARTAEKRKKGGPNGGNPTLCKRTKKRGKVNLEVNHDPPPQERRTTVTETSGPGPSPPSGGVPDHQSGHEADRQADDVPARPADPETQAAWALVAEFLHLHAVHWPDDGETRAARMPRLSLQTEARYWIRTAGGMGLDAMAALDVLGPALDAAMGRMAARNQKAPRQLRGLHLTLHDTLAKAAARQA